MSLSTRKKLIILGLLIIFFSLALLIVSKWPVDTGSLQATLEPTLFISP